MLSQSELEAIRSRADGTTDGGWSFMSSEDFITSDSDGDVVFALDMYRKEDATFIAHARTDVPALLDEVHALKHLLMRACGEIFGGVVMRPFMIEELRKHHVVEEDTAL